MMDTLFHHPNTDCHGVKIGKEGQTEGLASDDRGNLMDRSVASSMIVLRPWAGVNGAVGGEDDGNVRRPGPGPTVGL